MVAFISYFIIVLNPFIRRWWKRISFGCLGAYSQNIGSGNTKQGSITVQLTSCLTGLELPVWLLTNCVPTNPNQPNRRSKVQWYFPLWYSLVGCILLWWTMKMPNSFRQKYSSEFVNLLNDFLMNIFPWLCKPVGVGTGVSIRIIPQTSVHSRDLWLCCLATWS